MELSKLVKGLMQELGKVTRTDAVVGTVREAGDAQVVPLSKVTVGFGIAIGGIGGEADLDGDGKRDAGIEGGGAGGAVVVEPRAFVVVDDTGEPHMLAFKQGRAELRRGIEIAPSRSEAKQLGGTKAPALKKGRVK